MVEGCLLVSRFGASDVCCEQKGRVVRVVSRLDISGCGRHFVDGRPTAHGPPLESEGGVMDIDKLARSATFS